MTNAVSLKRPEDYRAEREHVYPSAESFRWFCRQNRAELANAGALVMPAGRWLVNPSAFDQSVMEIGKRRAISR